MLSRGVITILVLLAAININDITFSNKIMPQQKKAYKKPLNSYRYISHKIFHNNVSKKTRRKIYSKIWLSRINIIKLSIPTFPYRLKQRVVAKVTGYEPSEVSCGRFADGKTSIMRNAYELTGVAADPLALPYGTVVYIPGVGYRVVDDTGSALKKSWRQKRQLHIDLRFLSVKQAREWGVRYLEVEVYERIKSRREMSVFARAKN